VKEALPRRKFQDLEELVQSERPEQRPLLDFRSTQVVVMILFP
jgi:hypothetical protein